MNRLNRVMNNLERLPAGWQTGVRSFIIGKIIPFAGTASCRVEKLTNNECVVKIKKRRKVGNHIGTLHAAAMALSAGGSNQPKSSGRVPQAYSCSTVAARSVMATAGGSWGRRRAWAWVRTMRA